MIYKDFISIYLWFIMYFIVSLILLYNLYVCTKDKSFIHKWMDKLFRLNKENSLMSFFFKKISTLEEVLQEMLTSALSIIALVFIVIFYISIIIYAPEYFFERVLPVGSFICIYIFLKEYEKECLSYTGRRKIMFFKIFLLIFLLLISFTLYIYLI